MEFILEDAINILKRTPDVLSALLHDLPGEWTMCNEGGDTWSAFDVLGHLIHGEETDWVPRTHIILEETDRRFEPYDRFAQFEKNQGKSMKDLLGEFRLKRQANMHKLRSFDIDEATLTMRGIHPEFGEVTLRQMLATWVVHDLSHIGQIVRVMGKQYKEEVGPWKAYIRMLQG